MSKSMLGEWVVQACPIGSTHALKGLFAGPELKAQTVADLFCYNQNTGTGAFFATGRLDPGENGPHRVGENHMFARRWTHIVYVPLLSVASPRPQTDKLFLFYEAPSGIAGVYETEGNGDLHLKKQQRGCRAGWTHMIAGQFGRSNLLFYDAAHRVGAFYTLRKSGDIQFIEGWL